jgi:F0F1-type ATP synthase membrane subunit b/b'
LQNGWAQASDGAGRREVTGVDPLDRIDEIVSYVEGARSVPMSSRNCMMDRGEMIAMLDELRAELPGELRRAQALLDERDKIIVAGQREAERIISEGEAEHARLVSANEVAVSAEHEANRIVGEARDETQRLREECEEYVDTTLGNFERLLTKSLAHIQRGRDKMHALREIGSFAPDPEDEKQPFPS